MSRSTASLGLIAGIVGVLYGHDPIPARKPKRRLAIPRGNSKLYEPAPAIKRERTAKEKRRKAKRGY